MKLWFNLLIALTIAAAGALTGALGFAHDALVDLRFRLAPRLPTGELVVVAIDAKAIERVGVWPWSRTLHAELLRKLHRLGVANIAFDVDFSSRSAPDADQDFAQALEEVGGGAILPTFRQVVVEQSGQPRTYISRPLPGFATNAWAASVNIVPDRGGVVRRYSIRETIGHEVVPALAPMLTGWRDTQLETFYLDLSIQTHALPVISVADVLEDQVHASMLLGKRVLIGATAIELGDRFHVPVAGIVPGVTVQALAAETILQRRMLWTTGWSGALAGLAAVGLLVFFIRRGSLRFQASCLLIAALLIECGAAFAQATSLVIFDTTVVQAAAGTYVVLLVAREFDLRRALAVVAQHKFQSIAMSLGDGVVCADAQGRIKFWNHEAETIFGYTATEIEGQPFSMLHEPADQALKLFSESAGADPAMELIGVRKDGERFPLELRWSSWSEHRGRHFGVVIRDIAERKRAEARIRYLACHDPLTGLPNRRHLREEFERSVSRARQTGDSVGIILVGLDNFKAVNDALGYAAGDRYLSSLAQRLQTCAGPVANVGRLGGDEFTVVIEGLGLADKINGIARSITQIFGSRFTCVEDINFPLSASMGSAILPEHGASVDELLAHADLALQDAKDNARGRHRSYHHRLSEAVEERRTLEAELERAFERNEFQLYYQPQVCLTHDRIVGVEALIRWRHPTKGVLSPDAFIKVLLEGSLSTPVGEWILQTACAQAQQWHAAGQPIRVGVNLSPSQFRSDLPRKVTEALQANGLPAALLEVEVTEHVLLSEDAQAITVLNELRRLGVGIAFDDFGTGYASLSYLKRFPLDRLKIDRSFVGDLKREPKSQAIVASIIQLARGLGLSTTAEGVEDQACADELRQMGCDHGQGFHFAPPLPACQLGDLLRASSWRQDGQASAA